ncbi:hypothetical protein SAMN05216327_1093 [Dyadobacter sp. SG02]|uniref:hypothetical protein n=1 Tax=Dyadobacter sp. SG02 TaxID=1855291 RepID=UPI0008C74F17|nr:hypothetical protein [Dyadobacter sp. SG02]SEJ35697.1 hypothetical protein SAMN05216327_1093 [Dyadobacter sp. SG02]
MLQNRVDPYGQLIFTAARGHWTGNRGVIHNDRKEIIRAFRVRPWITCLLQFKGRHRVVMTPNRWTELFFLDEATGFSAGHRPCAECRRDDFNRFKRCWTEGNPEHGFDLKTPIAQIDQVLHQERINGKTKVTFQAAIDKLPDGVFISHGSQPYLKMADKLHLWTPFGYETTSLFLDSYVEVLTPPSLVSTIAAGYDPQIALP